MPRPPRVTPDWDSAGGDSLQFPRGVAGVPRHPARACGTEAHWCRGLTDASVLAVPLGGCASILKSTLLMRSSSQRTSCA